MEEDLVNVIEKLTNGETVTESDYGCSYPSYIGEDYAKRSNEIMRDLVTMALRTFVIGKRFSS